ATLFYLWLVRTKKLPVTSRSGNPTMRASTVLLCSVVLIQLFAAQSDAPLVIARGGFSGLFPDSSIDAYSFAMPDKCSRCCSMLTKDGRGVCFPDLKLNNASNIGDLFPNRQKILPG
ncbi:hypothetical protein HID58_046732, partial [Brassica napus]